MWKETVHGSAGSELLRDVLLPWGAVDVPHHALHHPFNSFIHPFAKETREADQVLK